MNVKHRRCDTRSAGYTSSAGYQPPKCVMCGEPVNAGQKRCSWPAPSDPMADEYGRLHRHSQATSDGAGYYRFDRKWGKSTDDLA